MSLEWDQVPDTAPHTPTPAMDAWDEVLLQPGDVRNLVIDLGEAYVLLERAGFASSAEQIRKHYWSLTEASLGAPASLGGEPR